MDSPANWSYLPRDILIIILNCLNAQIYHHLLRSVCAAWRAALPPPGSGCCHHSHRVQHLKIPLLHEPEQERSIVEKIYFLVSPPDQPNHQHQNWLVQVEETGPKKWSFFNPMNGRKFRLPPGAVTSPINLLDYRITELGRSLNLRRDNPWGLAPLRKMICSSNFFSMEDSVLFMALSTDGKLSFWRPGFEQWLPFRRSDAASGEEIAFHDIVSYKERIYAVDEKGRLLMIDPSTWRKSMNYLIDCVPLVLYPVMERLNGSSSIYLIASQGSLYLVVRVTDSTSDWMIKVYVLKGKGRRSKWVRLRATGDQVFFISGDVSFAVSSAVLGWNQKNCIYVGGFTGCGTKTFTGFRCVPWEPFLLRITSGFDFSSAQTHCIGKSCFILSKNWADRVPTRLFWPPPSWIAPC